MVGKVGISQDFEGNRYRLKNKNSFKSNDVQKLLGVGINRF